jgi:hypothetical protein
MPARRCRPRRIVDGARVDPASAEAVVRPPTRRSGAGTLGLVGGSASTAGFVDAGADDEIRRHGRRIDRRGDGSRHGLGLCDLGLGCGRRRRRSRRSGSGFGGGRRGWRRRRLWSGRRRGCRRRGRRPRRKKRERVDIRLVVGETDPEVHVRDIVLGLARGPCLCDRLPLVDAFAAPDEQGAEMRERRLVSAPGIDRDRRPVRRDLTGERNLAGRRRSHDRGAVERDVDSAMLAARVRVVAERVASQHRAVRWPGPRKRVRCTDQQPAERDQDDREQSRCPSR